MLRLLKVCLIGILLGCQSASTNSDGASATICALDMGSNTFKFAIGTFKEGKYQQLHESRDRTGVGDDIEREHRQNGRYNISKKKIDDIKNVVKKYQAECDKQTGLKHLHAIGTAAFRQAQNAAALVKELGEMNVSAEILTPERESIMAYKSSVFNEPDYAVVDFGSRSSEFATMYGSAFRFKEYAIGYRTSYDVIFKKSPNYLASTRHYTTVLKGIVQPKDFEILKDKKELVVIEGVELAAYLLGKKGRDIADDTVIETSAIRNAVKEHSALPTKDWLALSQTDGMDLILPKLIFLNFILDKVNYSKVRFTTRELYVGIVTENQPKTQPTKP